VTDTTDTEHGERYGFSRMTGTWYRITEWEERDGEHIVARQKEEVVREDVPQEWLDATDETTYGDSDE